MTKFIFLTILITIFFISVWHHEPWMTLYSLIIDKEFHIPEVLNLLLSISLGALFAFLLVLFVEWLKGSKVEIDKLEPVFSPVHIFPGNKEVNRKLLKIGVKVKANRLGKLLKLAANVHSFATITIYINHDLKPSYRAKWDNAPEPWEYDNDIYQELSFSGNYLAKNKPIPLMLNGVLSGKTRGYPRMNLLPQALQSENLVPDDEANASILAKQVDDPDFLIYDPEYYFNKSENHCFKKKVYIKVVFKSSLTRKEEYFEISNPNTKLENFNLKKISNKDYCSKIM